MIKSIIKTSALIFFLFSSHFYSQDKGVGIGAIFGEPTGLSGKIWINTNNAIDFATGLNFINEEQVKYSAHLDYLFHIKNIFSSENFIIHLGIGGRVKAHKTIRSIWGIRGIVGLDFLPSELPLDIFIEFASIMNVVPEFYSNFETGIGVRYYF
ncbi:MAG: hypothetical protein JXA68_09170 [Ignavibacteriales bacterium]|nr:hypothetical protein [Ignavibacteriales bacterium]